jgi:hypothetical protein
MEEADREFVIASGHNLHIIYYIMWREGERENERKRDWSSKIS